MIRLPLLAALFLLHLWCIAPGKAADRPNIIVIVTDDQGYADLGVQGILKDIKTPHLDQLAADGVRCTNGYVTAPQCIPSRAGLLSGRYQTRFGVDHNACIPMPLEQTLIPQRLQAAGYITGQVGKWHLEPNHQQAEWIRHNVPNAPEDKPALIPARLARPYMPDQRGFTDAFCGYINQYLATYDITGKDITPAKTIKTEGYRLDTQTDAAVAFIDRHAKSPFFLYLAYYAPHVPLEATDKYLKRFPGPMPERRRTALAMLSAVDDGVGQIRGRLRQHGLTDNTLIFFVSDNGAPLKIDMADLPLTDKSGAWDGSRNDPFVGEKGMLTEGGIRVPFIVTWPGTLPAGKLYEHPVISLDIGATAVALAGLSPIPELDGVNLVPHLTGSDPNPPHDLLYWRFWNQSAVRKGKWKYLQVGGDRRYLFDLSDAQPEKENQIADHPDIAAGLQEALKKWAAEQKTPGVPDKHINPAETTWYDHYLPGK